MTGLRYQLRQAARRPFHTAAAVLSMAAGLSVFLFALAFVDRLLLSDPSGVVDRGRLVQIMRTSNAGGLSMDDYAAVRDSSSSYFAALGAEGRQQLSLLIDASAAARTVGVAFVSRDYFRTLGTRPGEGRLPGDFDAFSMPVSVAISSRLAAVLRNGSPVVGRVLDLGAVSVVVVGVVPDGFAGARPPDPLQTDRLPTDMWLPLERAALWRSVAPANVPWLTIYGRLADAGTVARARRYVTELRLGSERAGALTAWPVGLPWRSAWGQAFLTLLLYLFVPLCVLGVACINVITVQLAQAHERRPELVTRLALGSPPSHLVRLLAGQGLLVSVAGSVLAWPLTSAALWFGSTTLRTGLSLRPLGFVIAALAAVLSALVVSIVPGWMIVRSVRRLGTSDAHIVTGHRRVAAVLVISQIAGCAALLFLAQLAIRMIAVVPYPPDHDRIAISAFRLADTRVSPERFLTDVASRLASRSDLVAFGFTDMAGAPQPVAFWPGSDSSDRPRVARGGMVTPGWLQAAGGTLLAGRTLDAGRTGDEEALVSESFCRLLGLAVPDAIGTTVQVGYPNPSSRRSVQIVGVFPSLPTTRSRADAASILLSLRSFVPPTLQVVVRGSSYDQARSALQSAVTQAAPTVSTDRTQRLTDYLRDQEIGVIRLGTLGAWLAAICLVLATGGTYAIVASATGRRTREFGLRLALGSTRGRIMRLVLRQGLRLSAIGAVVGLSVGVGVAQLMRSAIVGIAILDPLGSALSIGALVLAAVIASALPAYSASRTDPMIALRE